MSVMRIELLYWDGCPWHPETQALLEQVLAERGLGVEIEVREVRTEEEARVLRFPGSPTIRIDGRDVDPIGAGARPALTCRISRMGASRRSQAGSSLRRH